MAHRFENLRLVCAESANAKYVGLSRQSPQCRHSSPVRFVAKSGGHSATCANARRFAATFINLPCTLPARYSTPCTNLLLSDTESVISLRLPNEQLLANIGHQFAASSTISIRRASRGHQLEYLRYL